MSLRKPLVSLPCLLCGFGHIKTNEMYTLRHIFAVHCLKNGLNLRSLQKILGHTNLNTTQIYFDVIGDDIKKDFVRRLTNETTVGVNNITSVSHPFYSFLPVMMFPVLLNFSRHTLQVTKGALVLVLKT